MMNTKFSLHFPQEQACAQGVSNELLGNVTSYFQDLSFYFMKGSTVNKKNNDNFIDMALGT